MAAGGPVLRIREIDGRVRLGLEGFGEVEGASLQEAGDELVAHLVRVAMALRVHGVGPICSECSPDAALLEFVRELGEMAATGRDPRELLFGPGPARRSRSLENALEALRRRSGVPSLIVGRMSWSHRW